MQMDLYGLRNGLYRLRKPYYLLMIRLVLLLTTSLLTIPLALGQVKNNKSIKLVPKNTAAKTTKATETTPKLPVLKIVIDAGHGGHDPGKERSKATVGHEKDINLPIALKLGRYFSEHIGNVEIVYTRKKDVYVSLDQRVLIANEANADFFLSIHCNSNKNKAIHGTQIHIHSHTFVKSKKMAYQIDRELQASGNRHSLGVFNAKDRDFNLFVLQYTRMPGVLIETGFLSNSNEEKFLNSDNGQNIIAFAVFKGMVSFMKAAGHRLEEKKPITDSPFMLAKNTASREDLSVSSAEAGKDNALNRPANPVYRIQVMASDKPVSLRHESFVKLKLPVEEWISSNREEIFRYKYTVGSETTLKAALLILEEVRKKGFKDAFVIPVGE